MSMSTFLASLSYKIVKRYISSHLEGANVAFDIFDNARKSNRKEEIINRKAPDISEKKSRIIIYPPGMQDHIIEQIKYGVGTIYHNNIFELKLEIMENRRNLKERILRELHKNPNAKTANQWQMLCYLDRFKFENAMDEWFVEEGIDIARKTPSLKEFLPVFLHRKADLELRLFSGEKGIFETFGEIGSRYLHLSYTHGYYDALRQEAHANIQKKRYGEAYDLLVKAYYGLLSSDYATNIMIDRLPMDCRIGFIANTFCSFGRLWRAEGNLSDAIIALKYARFLYDIINQDHGVANTLMDIGLTERRKGLEFYQEGNLWLRSAERKFSLLGDDFRAKECMLIIEDKLDI